MKKIAIVLAGCGNKDGTEITEAVSLIVSLSQKNAQMTFFAPNLEISPKNFLTNEPLSEKRNLMLESARISRSQIKDIKELKASDFDALVFPGGYGAALHLCNWAEAGSKCKVHPEVERVIKDFHKASSPIAAICIAPVLLAKVLGSEGLAITLGADSETAAEARKTGAIVEECPVTDYISDRNHKIITTPAYMYDDANPAQVFEGIQGLANELLEMC